LKSYKNDFDEIKKIPRTSGIYYFYDEHDDILYIGKADSLYKRTLEHYYNHSLYREMKFFVKILNSKGLSIRNKEKLQNYWIFGMILRIENLVIPRCLLLILFLIELKE